MTEPGAKADSAAPLLGATEDDVTCILCCQVYVRARMFPRCGHTFCGPCHKQIDATATTSGGVHEIPTYACPVCRKTTTFAAAERPRNRVLDGIASLHPDYASRAALEVAHHERRLRRVPARANFGRIARRQRVHLCSRICRDLIPKLHDAARQGKSYVIIKDAPLVGDVEKVLDLFSAILFQDHNVYKVFVNNAYRELTILFTREAFSMVRIYENDAYRDPRPSDDGVTTDGEEDSTDESSEGSSSVSDSGGGLQGRRRPRLSTTRPPGGTARSSALNSGGPRRSPPRALSASSSARATSGSSAASASSTLPPLVSPDGVDP